MGILTLLWMLLWSDPSHTPKTFTPHPATQSTDKARGTVRHGQRSAQRTRNPETPGGARVAQVFPTGAEIFKGMKGRSPRDPPPRQRTSKKDK